MVNLKQNKNTTQDQQPKPSFNWNKRGKIVGRVAAGAAIAAGVVGLGMGINNNFDNDPGIKQTKTEQETSEALRTLEVNDAQSAVGGVVPAEAVTDSPRVVEVTALQGNGPWQMAESVAPHADQATMDAMVHQIERADNLDGQDGLQVGEKIQVELPPFSEQIEPK